MIFTIAGENKVPGGRETMKREKMNGKGEVCRNHNFILTREKFSRISRVD